MDPTTNEEEEEEWELCNNDGFVYKRKKRRTLVNEDPHEADPTHEESKRRDRKRETLLKIKNQYETEIGLWGLLSNNVRAVEDEARAARQVTTVDQTTSASQIRDAHRDGNCGLLLDELLTMVGAQEAVIHRMSNLCDTAEGIRNAKEEEFKQSLFDLPIWGSPRKLMSSLCDE